MPEEQLPENEQPTGKEPEIEGEVLEVAEPATPVTAAPSRERPTRELLLADLKTLSEEAKIPAESYAAIGCQLFKLNLVLEYLKLLENARAAEPRALPEARPEARPLGVPPAAVPGGVAAAEDRRTATRIPLSTRLEERRMDLIEKLRLYCWEALKAARLLLDELKCNTFPEDLQKELTDHPQRVEIKTNPPVPVLNEPTELSVWFHRQDYEHAPARDELFCWWTFKTRPDEIKSDPEEKGWDVWHVFGAAGTHYAEVTFRDAAGHPVVDANNDPVRLTKSFRIAKPRTKWYLRVTIELLQFLVSLVVVVVALMAGAMAKIEQLDNLDAIGTLIGVGFAANTVKNLITPPNTKT
jgi:hypothetical protein